MQLTHAKLSATSMQYDHYGTGQHVAAHIADGSIDGRGRAVGAAGAAVERGHGGLPVPAARQSREHGRRRAHLAGMRRVWH